MGCWVPALSVVQKCPEMDCEGCGFSVNARSWQVGIAVKPLVKDEGKTGCPGNVGNERGA